MQNIGMGPFFCRALPIYSSPVFSPHRACYPAKKKKARRSESRPINQRRRRGARASEEAGGGAGREEVWMEQFVVHHLLPRLFLKLNNVARANALHSPCTGTHRCWWWRTACWDPLLASTDSIANDIYPPGCRGVLPDDDPACQRAAIDIRVLVIATRQ